MGDGDELGNWKEDAALEFTSTDRIVWTHKLTIDASLMGTTSGANGYKVVVVAGDKAAWGNEYGADAPAMGGGNAAPFTFAEEVELLGGATLTNNFAELGDEVSVTLTIEFTSAIEEGKKVLLAGSGVAGLEWDETTLEMTAVDGTRTKFSVEIPSILVGKTLQLKVVVYTVGSSNFWGNPNYGAGGVQGAQDNINLEITGAGELAIHSAPLAYGA